MFEEIFFDGCICVLDNGNQYRN